MSGAKEEVKFCMDVMINKDKTKVLFAKVDNEFADVLLSFLALPLGTLVRVLKKHHADEAPILGSLGTLYNGVANLNAINFWSEVGKQLVLNPRSSFESECRKLMINLDDNIDPTEYYCCHTDQHSYRCGCERTPRFEEFSGFQGFTIKNTSYLITDDMRMFPNVTGSLIRTLSNLGIEDVDVAAQRTVILGFKEIMDLLKASLLSPTPLTDIILHKRRTTDSFDASESTTFLHQIEKEAALADCEKKKMSLNVTVQKSTNKFLFAQAKDDFVDFLFSFLTIPLGRVEHLLGSDTRLRNIDNLYRSAVNLEKYLEAQYKGNSILNPEIPKMHLSEDQFLPLSVERAPNLLYYKKPNRGRCSFVMRHNGKGSCVVGTGMYMVTDDLSVTPLCMFSSLSLLKELKIPLSDVEELTVDVGLNEALSILKASLTSTCALTNALNPILRKQPKQELYPADE